MKTDEIIKKRQDLSDEIEVLLKQTRTSVSYDEVLVISQKLFEKSAEYKEFMETDWLQRPQEC